MKVTRLQLRDVRSYRTADVRLGPGVTVVHGPNGTGKTNLVEALYLACTGRSCRTNTDREVIRFGEKVARVEAEIETLEGVRTLSVGLESGGPKKIRIDGHPVDRLLDQPDRPLVCVFLPDRLELVKGAPSVRRAHLDAVAAMARTRSEGGGPVKQVTCERTETDVMRAKSSMVLLHWVVGRMDADRLWEPQSGPLAASSSGTSGRCPRTSSYGRSFGGSRRPGRRRPGGSARGVDMETRSWTRLRPLRDGRTEPNRRESSRSGGFAVLQAPSVRGGHQRR